MLFLLSLAACRDGCPATALLEPVPALELCQFDGAAFSKPRGAATLEAGKLIDGAFVPFVAGDEVEIAPVPRDTLRLWYTLAALRITANTELPSTLCAQIDGDVLFTEDPTAEEIPDGVQFHRAADGSLIADRVPMFLGNRVATESGFDPLKTDRVALGLGGQAPTSTQVLFLEGASASLQPVNREGFLSSPAPKPDAGTPASVAFEVELQAMPQFLRPGESANVELRISGERLGQDVTLTVEPLPAGVTLNLDRTVVPASETLTSGRLDIDSTAAQGPFTLALVATSGTYTRRAFIGLQIVPGSTVPSVSLSASPLSLSLAPGETGEVRVRVVPFAGITGTLFLKALVGGSVEVTTVPESVSLASASDVVVRVKLVRSPFPGDTNTFSLVGVSGRRTWPLMQPIQVTSRAPASPSVFVVSSGRPRRFVQANVPLDWDLDFGTHVATGQSPPATMLLEPTPPMGCGVGLRPLGLRFTCDPTFTGAASVTASASSSAGLGSTPLRLVSTSGALVLPEVQPMLADSTRPEIFADSNGVLTTTYQTGLGWQFALITADGGIQGAQTIPTQQLVLVGDKRLQQASNRTLTLSNRGTVRADSMGPIAGTIDTDGTVWVASGALANALVGLGVTSSGAAETTWTPRDQGLTRTGTPIDVAISARSGNVVLASVEIAGSVLGPGEDGTVVVRSWNGTQWTTLPAVPSPAAIGLPSDSMGLRTDRVLALAHDAMARPVLAFIGTDDQLHLLRFESGAWVALGGATVGSGHLALSLSLAHDATGKVVLAWTEASNALPWSSGKFVQPNHAARVKVSWAQLDPTGFTPLPSPALDAAQGTFEQPSVTFDGAGRPVIAFIEDGRVVIRR
jgi:hypothetical protein